MYDDYLDIRQFAKLTHYSERQIRQKVIDGKIKATKLKSGRKWLIPRSELQAIGKMGKKVVEPAQNERYIQRGPELIEDQSKVKIVEVVREEVSKQNGTYETKKHVSSILDQLKLWKRDVDYLYSSRPVVKIIGYHQVENDQLFPYLLQHCPSVNEKFQRHKSLRPPIKDFQKTLFRFNREISEILWDANEKGEVGDWYYLDGNLNIFVDLDDYILFHDNNYL